MTKRRKIKFIGKEIRKIRSRKKRAIMKKRINQLSDVLHLKTLEYCLQHQKKLTTLNHSLLFFFF
jgi:hypothetical protein